MSEEFASATADPAVPDAVPDAVYRTVPVAVDQRPLALHADLMGGA